MNASSRHKISCKKIIYVALGFVLTILDVTSALSITISKMECVSEDVAFPGDVVYGNFVVMARGLMWGKKKNFGLELTVRSPAGNIVFAMKRSAGDKFEFKAPKKGTYKFCFRNPSTTPEIVTFHIQTGHIPNPIDKATEENFNPLNVKIAELRQALEYVTAEQKYLKAQEVWHRRTGESTRSRLFYYTMTEYILLGLVSSVQVFVIRHFFGKSIAYNIVG